MRKRYRVHIAFVCVVDFVNGRLIATFISLSVFVYSPDTLQSDVVINGLASIAIVMQTFNRFNLLTFYTWASCAKDRLLGDGF